MTRRMIPFTWCVWCAHRYLNRLASRGATRKYDKNDPAAKYGASLRRGRTPKATSQPPPPQKWHVLQMPPERTRPARSAPPGVRSQENAFPPAPRPALPERDGWESAHQFDSAHQYEDRRPRQYIGIHRLLPDDDSDDGLPTLRTHTSYSNPELPSREYDNFDDHTFGTSGANQNSIEAQEELPTFRAREGSHEVNHAVQRYAASSPPKQTNVCAAHDQYFLSAPHRMEAQVAKQKRRNRLAEMREESKEMELASELARLNSQNLRQQLAARAAKAQMPSVVQRVLYAGLAGFEKGRSQAEVRHSTQFIQFCVSSLSDTACGPRLSGSATTSERLDGTGISRALTKETSYQSAYQSC